MNKCPDLGLLENVISSQNFVGTFSSEHHFVAAIPDKPGKQVIVAPGLSAGAGFQHARPLQGKHRQFPHYKQLTAA